MKYFAIFFLFVSITAYSALDKVGYSGRLVNDLTGAPIAGPVDLKVDLVYSGSTATIQCTQSIIGVTLSNGIFNIELDFDGSGTCPGPHGNFVDTIMNTPGAQSLVLIVTRTDTTPDIVFNQQNILSVPMAYYAENAKTLAQDLTGDKIDQMGAVDGQALVWNNGSSEWEPRTITGGGGGGGGGNVDTVSAGNGINVVTVASDAAVSVRVDGTSIGFTGGNDLEVIDGSITTAKLNNSGVTPAKISYNAQHFEDIATVLNIRLVAGGGLVAGVPGLSVNTGTGANQIVQLDGTGDLPAVGGDNLTDLNATQLTTGTLPDARLNNTGTAGTYTKVTTDAKGRVTSGTTLAATDIPNLDTGKITTGTMADARIADIEVIALLVLMVRS